MNLPSKRLFFSARFSLMAWNTGLLALALLSFCALCRPLVRVGLLSLLDRQLTTRTEALIRFWEKLPPAEQELLRQQVTGAAWEADFCRFF